MWRALPLGIVIPLLLGCSSHERAEMAPLSERETDKLPAVNYAKLDALLKQQRGKVVVLAAWSIRHGGSVAAYDKLPTLAADAGELAIIALNIDRVDEVRSKVIPHVEGKKDGVIDRVLVAAPEEVMSLFDFNWGGQVPAISLFDRQGKRVESFYGADAFGKAKARVSQLLGTGEEDR